MSVLADALRRTVVQLLGRRSILVWYDPGATLKALAVAAVPEGTEFLAYDGSYLALRATFENADPQLQKRWVLYIPEAHPDPSWLRDLELAGHVRALGLAELVSQAFHVPTNARLRSHLAAPIGRLLAARWHELVPASPRAVDLERALIAAALELGADAGLQEVAIGYLSRDDAAARLSRHDLHPEFRDVLQSEGGLSELGDAEVPQLRVAAALLLSEAAVHGQIQTDTFSDALPAPDRRAQWCGWAERWMERADDQPFRHWSSVVAQAYDVARHLNGPGAARILAFSSVDEALLHEAPTVLDSDGLAAVRAVAEQRAGTYWARSAEREGKPLPWKTVLAAIELLEGSEEAFKALEAKAGWSMEELLAQYGAAEGWWRLDDGYRRLEAGWASVPSPMRDLLAVRAARAYGAFLDRLGSEATGALTSLTAWRAEGWESQDQVLFKHCQATSRTAVILADALRFELGSLLRARLASRGVAVTSLPMLAELPSVTQVGMAAIQATNWEQHEPGIDHGKFWPKLDGTMVRTREDRLELLKRRFPQAETVELDRVQQGKGIPKAQLLMVYAQAIDEQGDSLPQVGLDIFERLVWSIGEAVQRLFDAGFVRVLVVPDHGFVLVPREVEVRRASLPGADATTARSHRYAVGQPADSEGAARIRADRLGWSGPLAMAFPRGLAVFALPGETPRFFHGGPMPQETAVLALVCENQQPNGAPIDVAIVEPMHIDTTVPRFVLEGRARELMSQARRVRVVVRLDGRIVGESESAEVTASQRVELPVRLARYGPQLQVSVEDVETRERLDSKSMPVELPAGYDDLGL